jgi:AAA domain
MSEFRIPNERDFAAQPDSGEVIPITSVHKSNGAVELSLLDLRSLEVTAVKWIEKPFVARGELHILQGHGGTGKGALTCLWAAEASKRAEHVVMVIAEDDLNSQTKPRLIAAGADFDYVHVLRVKRAGVEDALIIPDDLGYLETLVIDKTARLVTVDPLLSHITGKTDSYKDHEIKRVLTPLSKLAQRTNCTIVGVHHFKKDTSGGARHSGQASTAFSTTARLVLSMAKTDYGLYVLEVSKSNIGPEGEGHNFRLEVVDVPAADGDTAEVPLLARDGEASVSVDEILAKPKRESKSSKARELILERLADGAQVESDELDAEIAQKTRLAARTVRDLRMELGNEGLIRSIPQRDESGSIYAWLAARTNAKPEVDA